MCFLQLIKDLQCFIHAQPGIVSSVLHFKPTITPAQGSCTPLVQLEAVPRESVTAINNRYPSSLTSGMNC